MPILKLFGAVAVLSAAIATPAPAPAQQVIYEPGYCAFFYPNANCQNEGARQSIHQSQLPARRHAK